MSEQKTDLEKLIDNINKKLNTDIAQIKDLETLSVQTIPSGSFTVDEALGVGGWPRGRIIEIYGPQAGGKTLLSLLAIAEAQKKGGLAAFIDVEHALDITWAKKLGVDVNNLYFVQPNYGEQALTIIEELAKTNKFDIIVLDSTAALVPKAELEGELEDHQIALQARMLSKALRRALLSIGKGTATVIFINQTRTNPMQMFGNPETTPGGEALKFYSSLRVNVMRKGGSDIKEGGTVIGHRVRIKVTKNKVAPPFKEAEFTIRYMTGVDRIDELATMAIDKGVIELRGPMYNFGDQKWQGRVNFITALFESENLQKDIWEAIKNQTKSQI